MEGRWVDGLSDEYGLACLAFRALTGQVPYPRPETAAVIYAHLAADPPPPSPQRAALPPPAGPAAPEPARSRPPARGGRRRGPGHREAARAAVRHLHGLHRRAARGRAAAPH